MPATTNVEGMVAQRQALSAWLRDLPATAWGEGVRAAVAGLCAAYVRAVDRDVPVTVPDDRVRAAEALDRVAQGVEATFADEADERWDTLSREDFRREGGTTEMGIDELMARLYLTAVELGAPVVSEARSAAVAAVVWRASDMVEAPVRIVLDGGEDYVVGPGEPEGTLTTDADTVLQVAYGVVGPGEAAAAGRWRFDGPAEAQEAFERTFRVDRGGD